MSLQTSCRAPAGMLRLSSPSFTAAPAPPIIQLPSHAAGASSCQAAKQAGGTHVQLSSSSAIDDDAALAVKTDTYPPGLQSAHAYPPESCSGVHGDTRARETRKGQQGQSKNRGKLALLTRAPPSSSRHAPTAPTSSVPSPSCSTVMSSHSPPSPSFSHADMQRILTPAAELRRLCEPAPLSERMHSRMQDVESKLHHPRPCMLRAKLQRACHSHPRFLLRTCGALSSCRLCPCSCVLRLVRPLLLPRPRQPLPLSCRRQEQQASPRILFCRTCSRNLDVELTLRRPPSFEGEPAFLPRSRLTDVVTYAGFRAAAEGSLAGTPTRARLQWRRG